MGFGYGFRDQGFRLTISMWWDKITGFILRLMSSQYSRANMFTFGVYS